MANVNVKKGSRIVTRKVKKTEWKPVEVEQRQDVKEDTFTITVDARTAKLLRSILGKIGGLTTGPCGAANELYAKLDQAGVGRFNPRSILKYRDLGGSGSYIQLADEWPEEDSDDDTLTANRLKRAVDAVRAQRAVAQATGKPTINSFHRTGRNTGKGNFPYGI